jgi:hypothetical protein
MIVKVKIVEQEKYPATGNYNTRPKRDVAVIYCYRLDKTESKNGTCQVNDNEPDNYFSKWCIKRYTVIKYGYNNCTDGIIKIIHYTC